MHFNNVEGNIGNGKGVSGCGVGAAENGDAFTMKRIMGRTPGLIKSKFLSVLDSSNGLLNGLSSKVDRPKPRKLTPLWVNWTATTGAITLNMIIYFLFAVGGTQFEFVHNYGNSSGRGDLSAAKSSHWQNNELLQDRYGHGGRRYSHRNWVAEVERASCTRGNQIRTLSASKYSDQWALICPHQAPALNVNIYDDFQKSQMASP